MKLFKLRSKTTTLKITKDDAVVLGLAYVCGVEIALGEPNTERLGMLQLAMKELGAARCTRLTKELRAFLEKNGALPDDNS